MDENKKCRFCEKPAVHVFYIGHKPIVTGAFVEYSFTIETCDNLAHQIMGIDRIAVKMGEALME